MLKAPFYTSAIVGFSHDDTKEKSSVEQLPNAKLDFLVLGMWKLMRS